MKRERNRLDSSLTLLSRDDPEMDLHGYRGTTDAPPPSKQKFSPETLLPFIFVIKCALPRCLHRDPLVHVTFNRIDRYRTLHAHIVPQNDIHWRKIVCLLIDRMLLYVNVIKTSYYVSINSWNDLILKTKQRRKLKVKSLQVLFIFDIRVNPSNISISTRQIKEREFIENKTKRN